jgi:hypothetical protein
MILASPDLRTFATVVISTDLGLYDIKPRPELREQPTGSR